MNANKTISILFGLLFILLSSQIVAKDVRNFYINGIDNTEQEARDSAKKLTEIFTAEYGHIYVNTIVESIYNESQGKFIDLIESGLQKTDLDKLLEGLTGLGLMTSAKAIEITTNISDVSERAIFVKMIHQHMLMSDSAYRFELYGSIEYVDNSANILLTGPGSLDPSSYDIIEQLRTFDELAFLLDLGFTTTELFSMKAINGISGYFNDVATETQQAYESQGYYTTQEYVSQQLIRTELDEVLNLGGAVNVIAHSQGNFFANEVLTNINQPDNTRLLSVGSPSGDLPFTGNYVNLREDMVVRGTKPNLGWNYSNISDDYWNNSINVATSFNKIVVNEFYLSFENDNVNADTKGHNLVTAYLKDRSAARERIIDALAEQYIALGGELLYIIGDASNDSECELLIENVSTVSSNQYEAKFYGNKCLFFGNDSSIMVYNLDSKTTEYLYNTDSNLDAFNEYNVFYDFVNNLKSAKADEILRNTLGLTLNTDGNVGCTIADNCVDGNITTVQQCTNLFEALTGVLPSVMNSDVYFNLSNDWNRKENRCYFWNKNTDTSIMYNLKTGLIDIKINQTGFSYSNGVILNYLPDGVNNQEIVIDIMDLSVSGSYVVRMFVNNIGNMGHGVYVDHNGVSLNGFTNDPASYTIDKSKLTTLRIQVPSHSYTDQDEIRIQFTQDYGEGGL